MAVCLLVQRSNEPECEEFEKLPVRLVEFLRMADSQGYLILVSRDLNNQSFICGCAITREVFERFRDRSCRPSKVEQNANGPQVHFCRDVQSEELVIRLCRGQLEKAILGSDGQADVVSRQLTTRQARPEQGGLRVDSPPIKVAHHLARGDASGPKQRALRGRLHMTALASLFYQFLARI